MCGIHGIISKTISREHISHKLVKMGKVQQHRGPDDEALSIVSIANQQVGFGFVRLSILDLETGMQPIVSSKDDAMIICNGQVYNYIELKQELSGCDFKTKGDIEVALHMYQKKGLDFLNSLNGMYAGAILDRSRKKLVLFRDRFGIKPLYYTQKGDNFYFASEIKPLLVGTESRPEVNTSAIDSYFVYRYVPGQETMFKGIYKLLPGASLEYDLNTGTFEIQRYWEYGFNPIAHNITLDEAASQFIDIFDDAVSIRLRADVEVGSFLSGGIDSSAVAAVAAQKKQGIQLFTIRFEEEHFNEYPRVQQFIQANEAVFHNCTHNVGLCSIKSFTQLPDLVSAVEEPICLGAMIPTDAVCHLASQYHKVVLTGEGADEIFAGYRKFLIESAAAEYFEQSPNVQKELLLQYPELELYLQQRHQNPFNRYIQSEQLFAGDDFAELLGYPASSAAFPMDARPRLSGTEHPLNAALALEANGRLPNYVILRLDKLSMRHSLETRTPFLDYRLAEFAATLPPHFKADSRKGIEKYIAAYAFHKYGVLDRATSKRKKQPFTIPMAQWLVQKESLPNEIKDILFGCVIKEHGILNQKVMERQLKQINTQKTRPETLVSAADRVFAMLVFTIWYENFIKKWNY